MVVEKVEATWTGFSATPLFMLTADQRVKVLSDKGFDKLSPLEPVPESPGQRFWDISTSPESTLRLPVDPEFSLPVAHTVAPWLDEHVWCLEQAKRNRNSVHLSADTRERLKTMLKRTAADV